jgi:hypothetical protein
MVGVLPNLYGFIIVYWAPSFFWGLCSKQQAAKLHEPCTVIFSPCAEHLQTGLRHLSTSLIGSVGECLESTFQVRGRFQRWQLIGELF